MQSQQPQHVPKCQNAAVKKSCAHECNSAAENEPSEEYAKIVKCDGRSSFRFMSWCAKKPASLVFRKGSGLKFLSTVQQKTSKQVIQMK
jgi:hypothetical protein